MPNTQKVIYLFKTEHCKPCELLHAELEEIVADLDGIHIEAIMCDDGDVGSDMAMKLGIRSTPHVMITDQIVGRMQKGYYTDKIRRLML